MRTYLKGLRLIWWDKSMDDLLFISFFPLMGLPLPFIFLLCIVQSFCFTYLYIKGKDTHSWYFEMIDRAGIYRCHLHNTVFSTRELLRDEEIRRYHGCYHDKKVWGIR